ncbi:MAG: 2-dehydropantoate 2-reductase [Proteobacteria bacterium]|nr:2-dehydropantoate 2-reductase [Pseudomonadota bacterium]
MMRIAIVGTGAIGGFLGTRLAHSGADVIAIARGATAAALRTHGWRMDTGGARMQAPAEIYDDPVRAGVVDVVIVAVKGPALPSVARTIAPLLGPGTTIVSAMNGVPWWFPASLPRLAAQPTLAAVDPDGALLAAMPLARVIGCVVHLAASTSEPGVVRHALGQRFIVGEPDGRATPRLAALVDALRAADLDVDVAPAIQQAIWYKLWGNMTMNPVSALTGATMDRILDDPLVNRYCLAVMAEAAAIGEAIGCPVRETGEARNAITRKLGAVKTSMLQDTEAGRPLEIDALLAAPREIGARVGVPTPNLDALLGLIRLKAQSLGLDR